MSMWMKLYISVTLALASAAVVAEVGRTNNFGAAEWASWVQAVGSIGAILGAIWISYDQQRKDKRRAKEDVRIQVQRMTLSVAEEIEALWLLLNRRLGEFMTPEHSQLPFLLIFNTPPSPFSVYDSHVGRIGSIDDAALRQRLISTYVMAMGMLSTFNTNNILVKEYEAVLLEHSAVPNEKNASIMTRRLALITKYGVALRIGYAELGIAAVDLARALRKYAAEN